MTDLIQGSDGWKNRRLGRMTASRLGDMMARTKTGWGATRANLMAALVAERLTNVPMETYQSAAMLYGIETEPEARAAYEFFHNAVEPAKFVEHPTIEMSGASPDGYVGEDGLVEIKCPYTATHIETLLGQSISSTYILQMQWQMACTGRKWCDFVSFDKRLPETMRLFVKRVYRDDARIAELEMEVQAFLDELSRKVAALEERYGAKAVAA